MPAPDGFSWIDKPRLAAMAEPGSLEEYQWLREHGIQFVICLTEMPPRRTWINEAGLFSLHLPIEDMHPPSQGQIDLGVSAIAKAIGNQLGVGVHCRAGMGRTGTLLACWLVHHENLSAGDAITRVRRLRPGSIETEEQADAIVEYARRHKTQAEADVP
jgi:atypical dual specificity phosphatase